MNYIFQPLFSNFHPMPVVFFVFLLFGGSPFKHAEINIVEGHGRLIEPPSRSTMWR